MTGFTLPGMMDDPGCVAGSLISPSPQRGPDPSQRMSLAIFIREVAMVLSWPETSTQASFAPWASKWFSASRNSSSVSSEMTTMARRANSGWVLMPVPTAVPPSASSASAFEAPCARSRAWSIWARKPLNSCPRVIGVASCRWVRPILMASAKALSFSARRSLSASSAGIRCSCRRTRTDTWMAVGMTSLDDCPLLTWSLGCTGERDPIVPPRISMARLPITSLVFMFVEVPEPVWKTSSTN